MDIAEHDDAGGLEGGYVVRALLRQVGTVVALVTAYFVLPLEDGRDPWSVAVLAVGLLAFGVLVVWQIRRILRSPHPVVAAAQALSVAVPVYLLLFATVYQLMSVEAPSSFSENLDRTDALYFTVTVFATVGFGDIAPVTQAARATVLVQMVANLLVLGLLLRLVTGAVRRNRRRRPPGA